jgi:hypothetical protein
MAPRYGPADRDCTNQTEKARKRAKDPKEKIRAASDEGPADVSACASLFRATAMTTALRRRNHLILGSVAVAVRRRL